MSTTNQIKNRIFTSISDEVKGIDPTFNEVSTEKNVTNAFSKALAPEVKLMEQYTVDAARQGNPKEADSNKDSDIGSLQDWGIIKLNRVEDAPTAGTYELGLTGTGTVAAGTQYVNQDTGFVYLVQTETIITTIGDVVVKSADFGLEVALDVGTELFSVQKIPGINNPGIVNVELIAPLAGEETEEYREDILQSFRITPRGGAKGDYVVWGDEIVGVRRVYPYSGPGLGDITQYVQEIKTVGNPQGEASPAIVTEVDDNATLKQPMTATLSLTTVSIIRKQYFVGINNLSDDDQKPLIQQIVDDYFDQKELFLDGVDIENEREDIISKAELMALVQSEIFPATIDDLDVSDTGGSIIIEALPEGSIPFTLTVSYT